MSTVAKIVNRLLEAGDPAWSEAWEPSPEILNYFQNVLRILKPNAVWGMPRTGQVYKVDKNNKTFTLIEGDPHDEDHWHDKTRKTLARLGWAVYDGPTPENPEQQSFAESETDPGYKRLQKFAKAVARNKKEGVTFVSKVAYMLYPDRKLMLCTDAAPAPEHEKLKEFMAQYGWTVRCDADDEHPDQMSFAETAAEDIRNELFEEAASPFAKAAVTLQYRPFQMDGEWKWSWVLLPDDRNKALAAGQGINRAAAAVEARKEARKLGVTIDKIDVLKPHQG